MSQRMVLLASLLALPLCAQQVSRRPSPFPEKNREVRSAPSAMEKSESRRRVPHGSGSRDRAATGSPEPATAGTASEETGKACFFVSSAEGALTAGGTRLDAAELVAAHAVYPLGSRVKVTNLANGKTVAVRIVDRFPRSSRIINVSEAAARQLGFVAAGTAEVRLEPVRQDTASPERQ